MAHLTFLKVVALLGALTLSCISVQARPGCTIRQGRLKVRTPAGDVGYLDNGVNNGVFSYSTIDKAAMFDFTDCGYVLFMTRCEV